MTIVSYLILALVVLVTLAYIQMVASIRPMSGPDSMALAGPLFLGLARALGLAVVITVAATRGGFVWIHSNRMVQWLGIMVLLGATAGMELWSLDAATSWYGRAARPWVAAFAVVAPLLLALLTAAALDQGRRLPVSTPALRGMAALLVLLVAGGALVLGLKNRVVTLERRAYVADREAEEQRAHDEKLSALQALGPESPLQAWLAYTDDPSDEFRSTAVESIRGRPKLNQELAEILRSDDPLPALRWLWLWSSDRPAVLAGALHDAASGLPEWARRRFDDEDAANDSDVGTACEALVVLVDGFRDSGLDFRPPIEALSAFLNSRALPEEQMSYDYTYQARSMLQYWFNAHASDAESGAPAP